MTANIFYVYQYLTEDGIPYYIGKGKNNRINARHTHTMIPAIEFRQFIKTNLTEEEAIKLEISLIKHHGRKIDGGILDNIKLNQWACLSGWNHNEETKNKISRSKIGVKKTEETKKKMSKPKSAEHIEKIRLANLGRPKDSRYEKISFTKSKQRWYSNGKISRMFEPGKELNGFYPGRKIGDNNNGLA
jgi:hypothetical protein